MATTQISYLVNELLSRTNQENNSNVSENDCVNWINDSLARLYDLMTVTYEDYNILTYQATLTGGAPMFNQIPILSAVNKVRMVEFQYLSGGGAGGNADNFYPIEQFMMKQRNRYGNTPMNIFLPYTLAQINYRVIDKFILVEPVASCAGTYKIWYQPKWVNLALNDYLPDSVDTNAWYQYAINDSGIKVFTKVQLDPSSFMQERDKYQAEIMDSMKNRDVSGITRTINIRRRSRMGGFSGGGMGGLM
jgi:hypothetical protein